MRLCSWLPARAAATVVLTLFASASGALALPFQQLIVFGDSLSDSGNDYIASGGLIPAAPAYGNGRFTDGSDSAPSTSLLGLWHEQLSAKLGLPLAAPSLAGGTDYAFGGAETGVGGLPVPGMASQLQLFLSGKASVPSNALYVFWGGSNDLFDATSPSGVTAAASNAISNIAAEIGTLASAGAKYFLWVNLPPLDQTPRGKSSPLQADLKTAAIAFNSQLSATIPALEGTYSGITIDSVDVYSTFIGILSNPGAYGITNTTDPAQGNSAINPDKYLFWDTEHPTTAGHAFVAGLAEQDFAQTSPGNAPEPADSLLLLSGMGILAIAAGARRRLSRRKD